MSDDLKRMWEQQKGFMDLLREKRGFPEFPVDITSKEGQQVLREISHHVMEELFEAGLCLKNYKKHRVTEDMIVDREHYLEEIVDVFHLLFELCIASGIGRDELTNAYLEKGETNEKRITEGY